MFGFGHLITKPFTYLISYFLTYLLTYFLSTYLRTLIPTYICTYVLTSRILYVPAYKFTFFWDSVVHIIYLLKNQTQYRKVPWTLFPRNRHDQWNYWKIDLHYLKMILQKKVFWPYSFGVEDFLINKLSIFHLKRECGYSGEKIESHSPQNSRSFLHGWAKKNRIEIGIVILKKNKTTFII